jgi:hypothetical protein
MTVLDKMKERGVTRYGNVPLQYLHRMFRYAALRESLQVQFEDSC